MASSIPWQGGRAVVVDDNAAAATLLAGFLRLIGHEAEVLAITDRDTLAQEILQRQNAALERLRMRYTVVEMTCNPEGVRLH